MMAWGCEIEEVSLKRNEDFKLSVKKEEFFVDEKHNRSKLPIMGRSGAGKSTFMNILAAMEIPQEGRIRWTFRDNEKIEWNEKGPCSKDMFRLRSQYFGFAFQDSTLIPHLTVLDNLCYPLLLKGESYVQAEEKANNELSKVFNEHEIYLERFPSQLSGGEKQRISLIQAIIHDPHVLFADEPTGSLDKETREHVMQVVYDWVDDEPNKRLFIWVTHHDDDPKKAGVLEMFKVDSGECKLKSI